MSPRDTLCFYSHREREKDWIKHCYHDGRESCITLSYASLEQQGMEFMILKVGTRVLLEKKPHIKYFDQFLKRWKVRHEGKNWRDKTKRRNSWTTQHWKIKGDCGWANRERKRRVGPEKPNRRLQKCRRVGAHRHIWWGRKTIGILVSFNPRFLYKNLK